MAFGSAGSGDVHSTRALSAFVTALTGREAAVVVDLGPAVGSNVTFLGEALGCKLHVENILSSGETWWPLPVPDDAASASEEEAVEAEARTRRAARQLGHADESIDGVLCWDVFDFLDDTAASALATEVMRVLKPGGVIFLCHGPKGRTGSVEYEILDEKTLRYRATDDQRPNITIRESRAFTKLFDGLTISNSFLLTSRMREVVFRKPPASVHAG